MSKSSIFENEWLDLVFEGKNKEYGAYQLRRESTQTAFKALFSALILVTALAIVTLVLSTIKANPIAPVDTLGPTIHAVDIIEPIRPPKQDPPQTNAPPLTKAEQPTLKNPEVVQKENASAEVPKNEQFPETAPSQNGTEGGTGLPEATGGSGTHTAPAESTETGIEATTYNTVTVDKLPTYPGGMEGFYRYVGKNFRTPEEMLSSGSKVKVLVSFVIEKDGSMTDIKVARNPGYGLDKEAIRVLNSMKTKWLPGSVKGKPVRVAYSLPIVVEIP